MDSVLLVLVLLVLLGGIVLSLAGAFSIPGVVILVAMVLVLAGSAAVGIDVVKAARSDGDGWIVAIARGIWDAIKTAFDFGF